MKSLRYLREPSFEALIQTEWLWNGFIIYFLGWNNRISIPLSSFLKQFNILMCLERETHLCIGILTSMTNAGCAHSKLTMWPPQPASRALQTSRHALASLLWCRWIVGTLCTFQMNVVVFHLIHIFSQFRLWLVPGAGRAGLGQVSAARHCDNSPELSWQNLGFAAAAGRGLNSSSQTCTVPWDGYARVLPVGHFPWTLVGGLDSFSFYLRVVSGIR